MGVKPNTKGRALIGCKDLRVIVGAEIGSFLKDMDRVSAKVKETAKKTEDASTKAESGIGRLTAVATTHEKAWGQVSNTMVGAGLLITGGLAASGKVPTVLTSPVGVGALVAGAFKEISLNIISTVT